MIFSGERLQQLKRAAMQLIRPILQITVLMLLMASAFAENDEQAESTSMADVQQDIANALSSIKDYSVSQRDVAVDQAGDALENLDEQIEELQERTIDEWEELSADAREARIKTLRELADERRELAEWYGAMKHSSTQAWGEVKEGFADAMEVMQETWSKAAEEFD